MTRREAIESSLAAWRDAERRLSKAVNGDREDIAREVERHRSEFQQLSAEHMVDQLDKLKEAESRRSHATPSTLPFHQAARDTQEIASDIWEAARESDEDTPQTAENHRRTPAPVAPGSD
jgi:rubrerythrin